MKTIRQSDQTIEIVPVGMSDGFTLYLTSNGAHKYLDHKWTLKLAVQRAYQILDSLV